MALRPMAPLSTARLSWESDVLDALSELLECDHGDAAAVLDANADAADALFAASALPADAAAQIGA